MLLVQFFSVKLSQKLVVKKGLISTKIGAICEHLWFYSTSGLLTMAISGIIFLCHSNEEIVFGVCFFLVVR